MKKAVFHSIIFLVVLLAPLFSRAQSQEDAKDFIIRKIEEMTERYNLSIDFSDVINTLIFYYKNPLNLNTATADELRSLGFLNEMQINNLLAFRKKNGYFESIYELKDVPGYSYRFIKDIVAFVKVAPPEKQKKFSIERAFKYGRSNLFVRYGRVLQQQKGYAPVSDSALASNPNSRYLGSPDKIYFRYRYTYRDMLSIGIVGDKDAGEEFFTGNNKAGFDFYTAHVFLRNTGRLKAVALGDYHLEFGQGLTLWSGLAFGKSADALNVQKIARGVTPNTSANENLYFRGAAATVGLSESIDFTVFYSNKGVDAGLKRDTLDSEELYFQSIQETGMHRTPSEIAKKNAINEQVFGGNISYNNSGLHLGVTAYKTQYDKELKKNPYPYQVFDFRGDNNFNAGFDMSYSLTHVVFFGEASVSRNGGYALLAGMIADLSPRFKMSLVGRDFQPQYQVVYAIPFAETSGAKNECGLYLGTQIYVGNSGVISAYYDIFSFPWLRYRVNSPSTGNEFLLQYENDLTRHFRFYLKLKSETKMLNYNDSEKALVSPSAVSKTGLRVNLRYDFSGKIVMQTRAEGIKYKHMPLAQNYGYLLFQDIQYRPESLPFDFSFRYAVFNTDSYDTRIYAYENDVLYKFSIPAYFYSGQKTYLLFHWDVTRKLDFWLKFAHTEYFDRSAIGNGLEEINGNKKSEVTAQIRWKF